MKIKKILNNNAILVSDKKIEKIWIGNGIGFQKKPGQIIDQTDSKIDKIFTLHQKNEIDKLTTILDTIPINYLLIADDIVKLAKEHVSYDLAETIYASLADHIYNLEKLYKEGFKLGNRLTWEIKRFYPNEFSIGKKALKIIDEKLGISFNDFEAGNIAMHLINAKVEADAEYEDLEKILTKINDIVSIIRMHNRVEVDEESFAFERFVTHMRFFFKRVERQVMGNKSNPLLIHAVQKYSEAYDTVKLIEKYLEVTLQDDEQLYLTLHIQKLIE
ncbi:PRD domain-containing protein [Amphibacillus sediminis]|uniref:PRD domain-containing protein n=1 Tax=Amphibacillus sediminis TaxID=360185 RepID=UPI00083784BA|nr:PRD domain-containing protein [Amphibacillus sediminis]